ncbi:hypothetical protein K7X08_031120 [Anisodus acutangulus]|uniref:Uncharacterized protein n=1 Tax=Anisodus acutangulus TaxID=402998 RepID=A0A9Q1RJ15_9SOLA|nr:hypothetical protein K7X08_031120 [Anisodus acutangulus]
MEKEAFPNEDELHVASALVLLSTTHPPSPKMKSISEISQIDALSYTTPVMDSKSKSSDSSIVTAAADDDYDDASFAEAKARARQIKMIRMIRVINKLKELRFDALELNQFSLH